MTGLHCAIRGRLLAVTALLAGLGLAAVPAQGGADRTGDTPTGPPAEGARPYTNPVSEPEAETLADPALIRGKDGAWYAFGTTDPLTEGEGTRHLLPIMRSTDLVSWDHVGDAFTEDTLPSWADRDRDAALWAPDVRYVDGEYLLYYVVTETTVTDEPNDNAIGVATAPTPTGPWTDTGEPVVGPRRGGSGQPGDYRWTFDPSHVAGPDGRQYLFYGSYYGGIWVTELSQDGRLAVGEPTMVAIDNKYEGAYVLHRGGYWYLFASSANCCAGPTTGYSVHVGRSRELTGPYVDREGVPLDQSRAGGTPVIAPNGNRWVGTGHNSVVTDLAGQDWLAYHAIDRQDPYLDGTEGINQRPMLLDRLDWVDGWPTVREGRWASEDAERSPRTDGRAVTGFEDGATGGFTADGDWRRSTDPDSGGYLESASPGSLLSSHPVGSGVRVEADVRVAASGTDGGPGWLTTETSAGRYQVLARPDLQAGALVVQVRDAAEEVVLREGSAPLPEDYDAQAWASLVLEVDGGGVTAELSHARLGDPLAQVEVSLPRPAGAFSSAGFVAEGAGAQVDNLSVLPQAAPRSDVIEPEAGLLDPTLSDEFDGRLDARWTAVRGPRAEVRDGVLRWPTEAADLVGAGNDASLLLRDVPEGDWVAETRLTIDLGTDSIRNFQQGGLLAYAGDDHFARLSHVAIWNTRQTEFGYELPYAGRLQYGGTIVGPPDETTWLRLSHTRDAEGEREVRASTSRDGRTWVHGGVWTFPEEEQLRVGLVSHGGEGAVAEFDYLRLYTPQS